MLTAKTFLCNTKRKIYENPCYANFVTKNRRIVMIVLLYTWEKHWGKYKFVEMIKQSSFHSWISVFFSCVPFFDKRKKLEMEIPKVG